MSLQSETLQNNGFSIWQIDILYLFLTTAVSHRFVTLWPGRYGLLNRRCIIVINWNKRPLLRNIGHISPRCVRFFPRHPAPSLLELTLFLGATSPLLMPWTALNVRALSVIDIWCSPRMVRCHFARSRWCNDCQKGKGVATAVSTCVRRERTAQLNMLNASFLSGLCPARSSLYIYIYTFIYMYYTYIALLLPKGCNCHFVKWQRHPFNNKGAICFRQVLNPHKMSLELVQLWWKILRVFERLTLLTNS